MQYEIIELLIILFFDYVIIIKNEGLWLDN